MAENISYFPFTLSSSPASRRLFCTFAPKGDGIIRLSLIWLACGERFSLLLGVA